MALTKYLACSLCAAIVVAAAACADGTGKALTPTLPTVETTTGNSDGTVVKAPAPIPAAPRANTRISNLTPTLMLNNATATYDSSAALSYVFQVLEGQTVVFETEAVPAGDTQTTVTIPANTLKLNKSYTWRARTTYNAAGNNVAGSWSTAVGFRTPLPPPVDGPVYCASSAGAEIVKCVGRGYPDKLVPTAAGSGSVERRIANMDFIRDRIIETAQCKGVNVGRNLKRGGPLLSHDFVVLRTNRDYGVDLATGYDEVTLPLRLKWDVQGADKHYGFPFYSAYTAPFDCSNLAGQP